MEEQMTLAIQPFSHEHHPNLPAPLQAYLKLSQQNHQRFIEARQALIGWIMTHEFIPEAIACVDERLADFSTSVLGLPPGTCHMIRSPGLKRCRFKNATYARRVQRTRQRIENVRIGNATYCKRPMCFAVAHYSAEHADHGCAACKNDTELALQYMRETATELRSYLSDGVVLECLLDTDRDALKIFNQGDSIDVRDYLDRDEEGQDLFDLIRSEIVRLFQPRSASIPAYGSFVYELTEYLVNDIGYARSTKDRPFESCIHQGRMIIIGGPLETTDRNAALLIEKGDSGEMIDDLQIAIPIIVRNILQDVVNKRSTDTRIPILVSLDYDMPRDRHLISEVALGVIETLKARLGDIGSLIADRFANELWWQQAPHDLKKSFIENPNLFWQAAVYEQNERELHLVCDR